MYNVFTVSRRCLPSRSRCGVHNPSGARTDTCSYCGVDIALGPFSNIRKFLERRAAPLVNSGDNAMAQTGGTGQSNEASSLAAAAAFAVVGFVAATALGFTGIAVGIIAAAFAIGALSAQAVYSQELSQPETISDLDLSNCFPAGTLIQLPNGSKPIEDISPGDTVMAFDKFAALTPRKVVRLFHNVTDRWFELSFERGGRPPLIVTPGHHFLTPLGSFETIERMLAKGSGRATLRLRERWPRA